MEPAMILLTSTVLLAAAALGGLVMAGMRFAAERQPPVALANWQQKPLPKWLIVGHAGAAVVGFAMLAAVTWATRAA